MLLSYDEALDIYGSDYQLKKAISKHQIYKIEKGIYSDRKDPDVLALMSKKYPLAVIDHEYAFYLYNLIRTKPDKITLITPFTSSRIKDERIRQSFIQEDLLYLGVEILEIEQEPIYTYNLERLLVELVRNRNKYSKIVYREAVSNYRKIIKDLSDDLIQEYLEPFKNKEVYRRIIDNEIR